MATITIERAYLDTLLRRANSVPDEDGQSHGTIKISRVHHEHLLRYGTEYQNLRQALIQHGVAVEAVDALARRPTPFDSNLEEGSWDDFEDSDPLPDIYSRKYSSDTAVASTAHEYRRPVRAPVPEQQTDETPYVFFPDDPWLERKRPNAERRVSMSGCTLQLSNLPEGITLKEITSVIRGGRLLELHVLRNERSVNVTFAEGAAEFLGFARRSNLCIRSKVVEVNWGESRPSIQYARDKLNHGATRNLVIRAGASKFTDEEIRRDFEHIHNLVIIYLTRLNNDVFISTNSVSNAMFAKTCMLSRLPYKTFRIEFFADECAQALPAVARQPPRARVGSPVQAGRKAAPTNRFNLLQLDDGSVDEVNESDDDSDGNISRATGVRLIPRSRDTSSEIDQHPQGPVSFYDKYIRMADATTAMKAND